LIVAVSLVLLAWQALSLSIKAISAKKLNDTLSTSQDFISKKPRSGIEGFFMFGINYATTNSQEKTIKETDSITLSVFGIVTMLNYAMSYSKNTIKT